MQRSHFLFAAATVNGHGFLVILPPSLFFHVPLGDYPRNDAYNRNCVRKAWLLKRVFSAVNMSHHFVIANHF